MDGCHWIISFKIGQQNFTCLKVSRVSKMFEKPRNMTGLWVAIMTKGSMRCTSIGNEYHPRRQIILSISSNRPETLSPNSQINKISANDQKTMVNVRSDPIGLPEFCDCREKMGDSHKIIIAILQLINIFAHCNAILNQFDLKDQKCAAYCKKSAHKHCGGDELINLRKCTSKPLNLGKKYGDNSVKWNLIL